MEDPTVLDLIAIGVAVLFATVIVWILLRDTTPRCPDCGGKMKWMHADDIIRMGRERGLSEFQTVAATVLLGELRRCVKCRKLWERPHRS